jgi:hypothetical protein
MKKLILIGILFLTVVSCKTSKTSCDAYGSVNHDNNTLSNDTPVVYQKHLTHP